jgi:hypothetical protein
VESGQLAQAIRAIDAFMSVESERLDAALRKIDRLADQVLDLKKEMAKILLDPVDPAAPTGETPAASPADRNRRPGFSRARPARESGGARVMDSADAYGREEAIPGGGGAGASGPGPARAFPRLGDMEFRSGSERLIAEEAVRDLRGDDVDAKIAALGKLGKMRMPALLPLLGRHLHDGRPRVRSECVKAVAATGTPEAVPLLVRTFAEDASELVRIATLRGLCDFVRNGKAGPDLLVEALVDTSPLVRAAAARYIGWTHVLEALPHLLLMLGDPSADVRKSTVDTLGLLNSPQAIEPLLPLLEDESPAVRERATKALSGLTGSSPGAEETDVKGAWMRIAREKKKPRRE